MTARLIPQPLSPQKLAQYAMHRRKPIATRSSIPNCPRGVAVVELAICLPILLVILLATVETCVMLQLQQNLAVTAYEGARIGIMPGIDAGTVQAQCEMLLSDRNVNGYTITMNPADPGTMNVGDNFTVAIDADCSANSVFGGMFFQGKVLNESVVMQAE